jgi:hypothetical protein
MTAAPRQTHDQPLRLQAFDAEDLALISAHLQDATLRVCDLAFFKEKHRFAIVAARFDWSAHETGRLERCASGLHFDHVSAVRSLGFSRSEAEAMLALLAILFEPEDQGPEGRIRLIFAGGAEILLEVGSVEAQLRDLGTRWPVSSKPTHPLDEDAATGP